MVNRGFLLADDAVAVTAYAGSMNTPLAQDLTILTGASRGMGLALARQLMRPGHLLLCLSRHVNPELEHEARAAGVHLEQWAQDLGDAGEAVERLERWLHSLHPPAINSATLINNAGLLPSIGLSGNTTWNDMDPRRPAGSSVGFNSHGWQVQLTQIGRAHV